MRGCNFLKLTFNKITSRSYSYIPLSLHLLFLKETIFPTKVEKSLMDKISNTTGVNLVKVIFGIFPILAIRNK
jgi:hypothetical protein